ncbi:hypothetical protein ATKI12_6954 [Kitasatospora sp. Ki12]
MTQTFRNGDEVEFGGLGGVTGILRGDRFTNLDGDPAWLVERTSGHRAGKAWPVAERRLRQRVPDFEHGAAVMVDGEPHTIAAGPFRDQFAPDRPWYVVEDTDGNHGTHAVHLLKTALADDPIGVGDWVRVLEDDPLVLSGHFVGKTGVVRELNDPVDGGRELRFNIEFDAGQLVRHGTWNVRRVERVDEAPKTYYTYGGVQYDLTAAYRDRDGDVWRFTGHSDTGGRPLARMSFGGPTGRPLPEIINVYGPLTKTTA